MLRNRFARVALLAGLAALAAGCDNSFVASGTMVQGAECLLFEADGGKQYVLDKLDGLEPGDQVTVIGRLDPNCATVCSAGNGCITATLVLSDSQEIDNCGKLIAGAECPLFQADGALGTYVLDQYGGFTVGARVRVSGQIRTDCISTCMQGNGCIHVTQISACTE